MEKMVPTYKWTVAIRVNHWLTAAAIFILIITGFFIAYPVGVTSDETVSKFSVGTIRFLHIFFGVILMFAFIWRIYLAFFSKFNADWKDFFAWTNWQATFNQIKFYLSIVKEEPAHHGTYGPVQSMAYIGLFGMIVLILVTGLILMGGGYNTMGFTSGIYWFLKPVESMLGGLAMVRLIHHILTWAFVLFIVAHIYMAFWYDAVLKNRTLRSMFDGNILEKHH